jgi:hypothetical protein
MASTTKPTTNFVSLLQIPSSTCTRRVNHERAAGESGFYFLMAAFAAYFPTGPNVGS